MLFAAAEPKDIEMDVPPAIAVGSLITKYCAKVGGGLAPSQVALIFDGDKLEANKTLTELEVEDEDLLDVKVT